MDDFDIKCLFLEALQKGSNWQKQQYTIEEQHVGHSIDELSKEYIKGFNEGSAFEKQQAEKHLYSQDDMKLSFEAGEENVNSKYTYKPFEEWLKQFKK
jgi:hypothetical protein